MLCQDFEVFCVQGAWKKKTATCVNDGVYFCQLNAKAEVANNQYQATVGETSSPQSSCSPGLPATHEPWPGVTRAAGLKPLVLRSKCSSLPPRSPEAVAGRRLHEVTV